MIEFFLIFLLMTLTDFVWSISIKAISGNKVLLGGLTAAMLVILNGVATISYINNYWLLVPAALGAFTGVVVSKYVTKK